MSFILSKYFTEAIHCIHIRSVTIIFNLDPVTFLSHFLNLIPFVKTTNNFHCHYLLSALTLHPSVTVSIVPSALVSEEEVSASSPSPSRNCARACHPSVPVIFCLHLSCKLLYIFIRFQRIHISGKLLCSVQGHPKFYRYHRCLLQHKNSKETVPVYQSPYR